MNRIQNHRPLVVVFVLGRRRRFVRPAGEQGRHHQLPEGVRDLGRRQESPEPDAGPRHQDQERHPEARRRHPAPREQADRPAG
ncbi:MAG: hypothetical protein M0C28_27960 [Candidatus Moduliflexus flocculans]|nr:hypothetical protein [Candidatus Moduliflexus flocculans]